MVRAAQVGEAGVAASLYASGGRSVSGVESSPVLQAAEVEARVSQIRHLQAGKPWVLDPKEADGDLQVLQGGCQVRKCSDYNPDYSTVCGDTPFASGQQYWEVRLDQLGNMRMGVARLPIRLDLPFYDDVNLGGSVWYLDYDGECCENVAGQSRRMKSLASGPLAAGDYVGFQLDMDQGTLSFFVNGKDQGVAFMGLEQCGPLHPVFNLDNQDEKVTLIAANGDSG